LRAETGFDSLEGLFSNYHIVMAVGLKEAIVVGIVLLFGTVAGVVIVQNYRNDDAYQHKNLLKKGMDKPVAWIYLNNSDVNSRSWYDFMGRSSRAINLPFLNLCYETIVKHTKKGYRVEVITGLPDLASRLGGWSELPEPLQNPDSFVREPEMNWIRAAVLAKFGGLWVSPSTIWLQDLHVLPKDKVVFFGANLEDTYSTNNSVPALNVVWSPAPRHPVWVKWESTVKERLNFRTGGSEFRHDERRDFAETLKAFPNDIQVVRLPEVSRKDAPRRRIQIEDLLETSGGATTAFNIPNEGIFVPIPLAELLQRESFGWFLRMSEDQILGSDMVISHLYRKAIQ
jgi:hypothetical protein